MKKAPFAKRPDLRIKILEFDNNLMLSEKIGSLIYAVPWFKKYEPEIIEEYADAFKKAAKGYKELLGDDPGDPPQIGNWHFFKHSG